MPVSSLISAWKGSLPRTLKVLVGMSLSSFFMGLFGANWQAVDRKIARDFTAVDFVSTDNLLTEQQLSVKPTIIDVRLP